MTALSVILWGLGIVIGLPLLALMCVFCTRLRVIAHLDSTIDPAIAVQLVLLSGLIRFELPVPTQGEAPPHTPTAESRGLPRPPRDLGRLIDAAQKLFARIAHRIRIDPFEIDARIGLRDPADTGIIFGLFSPVLYSSPVMQSDAFRIQPDFSTARLDVRGRIGISFVPGTLLLPQWHSDGPFSLRPAFEWNRSTCSPLIRPS